MNIDNKSLGYICVISGIFLFMMFSGELLLRLIGALFSLALINYGLILLKIAPLNVLAIQAMESFKSSNFTKK